MLDENAEMFRGFIVVDSGKKIEHKYTYTYTEKERLFSIAFSISEFHFHNGKRWREDEKIQWKLIFVDCIPHYAVIQKYLVTAVYIKI